MKKKWKNWLKRAGILLLSAAMLAQTAGSFAYAGRGLYRMEELQEVQGEQALKGVEDTKDRKETEERKEKDEQKERKAESVSKEENTSSKNQNQEEDGENEKENGYTRVTESEADDAADKEQQETQSRVTDSEVTESGKEDMSHQEQEQYHFQDGDARSVRKWMELYLPGGYGDIRSREEGWWQNLYDYERELAEFIRDSLVELDPAVYCGQDISEILAVLERGISMDSFFEGTVFQALDPADLYALQSGGWTLDDVYRIYCMYLEENCDWEKLEEEHPQSLLKAAEKLLAGSDRGMEAYSLAAGKLEEGDRAADISVRSTGYSGTGHGTIYKITLGGDPALCMSMGKHARNGYKYFAGEGDYERRNDGIGYLLSYAALSGKFYAVVQIAAWLYLESKSLSRTQVISRAASMVDTSAGEAADMAEMVWEYYQNACRSTNIYYVFRSANSNSQLLGCRYIPSTIPWEPGPGGEEPENPSVEPEFDSVEDSVSVSYQVQVEKKDWQTAVGLAGCVIDIFENGTKVGTVTTGADGRASWQTSKSASFQAEYCSNYGDLTPEQKAAVQGHTSRREALAELEAEKASFAAAAYTYSTREVTAPGGYVWQANEKADTISGNGTAVLSLTNERTLGRADLIKYDTEGENGSSQGEAELDGAVYGIYAAENIVHADGRTGILYRKDALAGTAVVGRSPRRNSDGYLLNTDGTRHIAYPGGTIAYEDTPGRTGFGDLELGSYYIREITPAPGYMLDETRYDVTFTYKNQMTRVELRNEQAGEAENTLTMDDGSSSHTVYTGDYVIKQGIQFVKTSDNAYQTELEAIEGAGFSIYLIRDLAGVKQGTLAPVNGSWSGDDILAFYDYDFTHEERAVLCKRTGQEEWTEGDKKWLTPLGTGNRYQVAEMFTDREGCIETPELPYGTYVIVETTTPEHHVMAKPFIVQITQDGGILYTDKTKQIVEKTYTPAEGIRYGDRKNTKDREGRKLQKQRIINNTITTAFLRIVKADAEFLLQPGACVKPEELVRGTVLKEGVKYRLRCLQQEKSSESLKALNWKWDKEGYLSYYVPGEKVLTGTQEHPFETSFLRKNGKITDCYITLPRELPVGTYELVELTAPKGYVLNGFEQAVKDTGTEREHGYEIVDAPEGRTVFVIENGSVYPDGQMGVSKYALCDSYGNLTVTVLQKNQEQKGIIEIYKHGEQLCGAGEDTETLLDKLAAEPFRYLKLKEIAAHKDKVFTYEEAPVEGACFQIVAAEDIYSQELDPDLMEAYGIDTEAYRVWKKGDVAAEISTDRNGYAYAAGLYIGTYKIRETVAGSGFVLNTKEEEFSITPQKQTVSFDIRNVDYRNERQRLELQAVKKDRESGEYLAGAVYGLYAAEDICAGIVYSEEKQAWILKEEPEVLFPAGSLIATCITDQEGKALFDEDLPLGKYEIRELEAPVGYLLAEEPKEVDGSYEGEKGGQEVQVQEHTVVQENQITRVRFQKLDETSGQELAGALLEIWELPVEEEIADSGRLREVLPEEVKKDSWISTGPARTVHQTEGLQLGRTYAYREAEPAPGYVTAEDIYFRLEQVRDEEGKLTDQVKVCRIEDFGVPEAPEAAERETANENGTEAGKTEDKEEKTAQMKHTEDADRSGEIQQEVLVMEDDVTKVQISKKDITTKEELPGAFLELYDGQGKLLESWVSTDTPHYIERLPIGTYRLTERKAPEGYACAKDVVFRVLDTDEIQTVVMEDDVEKEKTPEEPKETPEQPAVPQNPEQPGGGSGQGPETFKPQEITAPELGDMASAEKYLCLLLLAAAAGIVCWRRIRKGKRGDKADFS